jgi:hypothetical protein
MSSPFDNIDEPSEQSFPKPRYIRERQRVTRESILLVTGVGLFAGMAAAIYELFAVGAGLDCLWRFIGGFVGALIGSILGAIAAIVRIVRRTIVQEVFGQRGGQDNHELLLLSVAGALFGSGGGAMICTEGEATVDFFISALVGGGLFLIAAAIVYFRRLHRQKQLNAEN